MIPRYDVPESECFNKSEEEIKKTFIESLKPYWPDIEENIIRSYVHSAKIVQALWVDQLPQMDQIPRSKNGRVWIVNAELAGRDTLNNNALVGVANRATEEVIQCIKS